MRKCDACSTATPHLRYAISGHWAKKWDCRECWILPRIVDVRFGLADEWKDFERRHPRFLTRLHELQTMMDQVVSRELESVDKADTVIFYLGRLAVEDFNEVLLNAGNGYGVAALKLLRTLSERTITMMYLSRHSNVVDDFLDHRHVQLRKTISHIRTGGAAPEKYFTADQIGEIEAEFQTVKDRYIETLCEKCGTTRPGISWTKLDLASMARELGLGPSYVGLCYFPTLQIHTTVTAITTRLEATAS